MGLVNSSGQGEENEESWDLGMDRLWVRIERFKEGCAACCSKCRHNEHGGNAIDEVIPRSSQVFWDDERIVPDMPRDSFAIFEEGKQKSPMTQRDAQRLALAQLQPATPNLSTSQPDCYRINIQHYDGEEHNQPRRTKILPLMPELTGESRNFDLASQRTNDTLHSGLHIR
eukprot:GEMP01064361.1.p1 GENE.GEMP01064361.1~~GEMP01064361.1.p1  ORF type:complete len:171 (+),score=34.08 GEMP01064361.1:172-684(+)